MLCLHCRGPLIFSGSWRHADGSTYAQVCRSCGWRGGRSGGYTSCPGCGRSRDLADDHVATPDYDDHAATIRRENQR